VQGARREASHAAQGERRVSLPVDGAAKNHLQLALEKAPFQDPAFPVIANATAEAVKDTGRARRLLADQLRRRCGGSSACSTPRGCRDGAEVRWVENRAGAVLAGLFEAHRSGANVVSLGTAAEVTKFMESA